MTLRIVIVDDERPARNKLRRYMAAAPDITVVGEAGNGWDAVTVITQEQPDVVFLDVQMPGMDGFAVMEALGESPPAEVVFVTAHGDYALQAFEVHAFDYLLKPVSPQRFDRLLRRMRERIVPRTDIGGRLDGLLNALPPTADIVDQLLIENGGRAEVLPVDRITHIEADRNYLVVHTDDGGTCRLRGTLERMQARLDPSRFTRVNRSTLVRLAAVRETSPWPDGEYRLVLADGSRVTWTRRYVSDLVASVTTQA